MWCGAVSVPVCGVMCECACVWCGAVSVSVCGVVM